MEERQQLIRDCIRAAGGQTSVALDLGIKQQSVFSWIEKGLVPAPRVRRVIHLAAAGGFLIDEVQLNPEVFY